jgi:RNA polymerase sigma factor (sigma-70 family)
LSDKSDAQLVAGAMGGSERAFRQLVERHHPTVFAVVRSVLGDRDDVEDVVQEVFIKVYRGLATFRGDARFSTWIYRIARNESINAVRKKTIEGSPIEDVVVESPAAARPDTVAEREAERTEIGRYLAQLDDNYRTALELRYIAERSYAEIAEAMELPIGTVKSYIHRAKIELKRLMMKGPLGT